MFGWIQKRDPSNPSKSIQSIQIIRNQIMIGLFYLFHWINLDGWIGRFKTHPATNFPRVGPLCICLNVFLKLSRGWIGRSWMDWIHRIFGSIQILLSQGSIHPSDRPSMGRPPRAYSSWKATDTRKAMETLLP